MGQQVWVEFAHRRVYNMVLSPGRRDAIAHRAGRKPPPSPSGVVDAGVQRLLFRDPDLAPDEFWKGPPWRTRAHDFFSSMPRHPRVRALPPSCQHARRGDKISIAR